MKLTLQQAQNIANNPIFTKELPIQMAYKFSKLGKALVEELKLIEDHRGKLIEQYKGVLSEDQAQYTFSAENAEGFQKDMITLLEVPFEVPFEPIAPEDLGNVTLTPNELLALDPLFS